MRGAALALVLLAGAAPAAAQERGEVRDVPWYAARPAVLEETLKRCHRDARAAATWDCQNAEGGANLRRARGQASAPARASGIGADGLPDIDYNPRTNPLGYSVLLGACTHRKPGSEMWWPDCHKLKQYQQGSAADVR